MVWIALLIMLGFLLLWRWLDKRLTEIDEMFNVLALGIRKAKEEVIEDVIQEVWLRQKRDEETHR